MRTARVRTVVLLGFLGLALLLAQSGQAGVISLGPAITDDASTGISSFLKTYTHAVSGGEAVTVNGVSFDLLNSGTTPPNFVWDTHGRSKNQVTNNNNNWNPATGGVTGAGAQALLNDFTYSGNGPNPGDHQSYTISGLTPGSDYETRLYIRAWDTTGGSGRPIDVTFTNGTEVDGTGTVPEDRPSMLGYPSDHSAYYVSYAYTAQGTTMTIDAAVPAVAPPNSGSAHLYALTNEDVGTPGPGRFFPITNDADSEISAAKTYTHAVDFGSNSTYPVATVNGVAFVGKSGAGSFPSGGAGTVGTGSANIPNAHSGSGGAATGIPGGNAVENLVQDFNYNNSNAEIRLDGLTIGQTYDVRLYQSVWGGDRTQRFEFETNGVGDPEHTITFNPDNPGADPPGVGTNAYALSYAYTAESESLTITATQTGGGSYHAYGLTNEVTGPVVAPTVYDVRGRVFSTGVDSDGNVLPPGTADPHYKVAETPGNPSYNQSSVVQQNHGAWLANDPAGAHGSSFTSIVPQATNIAPGAYVTSTSFSLVGWDASTASIQGSLAVDDSLSDVRLNGASLSLPSGNMSSWTDFAIPAGSGFLPGDNTLEFVWNNGGTGNNPGGLRVELAATATPVTAPGTLRYIPITNDADSEIRADKIYTVAVDFGNDQPGANINGVQFTQATPSTLPANVKYDVTSGGRSSHGGNGNHNVSGAVVALFEDMIYNGNNAPGGSATVTIEGLIPGVTYDTRFYTRQWGPGTRTADIGFDTNANGFADTTVTISQDNASVSPPGFSDANQAYAISYTYVAQTSSFSATFTQQSYNASWHQYGVTNEIVSTPPGTAAIGGAATADNHYELYLSDDDSVLGTLIAKSDGALYDWQTAEALGFLANKDETMYLHAVVTNDDPPAWGGFIAHLELYGLTFLETGTDVLETDDLLWLVNDTGFGDPMVNAISHGGYGVGPWGTGVNPDFPSTAEWLWLGQGYPARTLYFSTSITVVPEPATMLLLIGGLGALIRRRRRKA